MNKKIVSVILVIALCLTNVGVATFAASIVSFANHNVGVENNNGTLVGKYYEKYKTSQTMLLMNDNNETTEGLNEEETTLNEDLLNDKSESFDEADTDETKDIDLEEDLETEAEETEAEETEAEETEAEETEAEQTEVEAEETVAEDATEVSDEEKETELETEVEVESKQETETETETETTVEETTVDDTEELSIDIATDSYAKDELDLFGAGYHTHRICGAVSCNHPSISNHAQLVTFGNEVAVASDFPGDGLVYLTDNVQVDEAIGLTGNLTLCLNGFNLTNAQFALNGFELWITNCQDTGYIAGSATTAILSGTGKFTMMKSLGDSRVEVKADKLIEENENIDLSFYNAKLAPTTTTANGETFASVAGNITLRKSLITGFNKSGKMFEIIGTANVIDTIIEGNTMTNNTKNSVFNLHDVASITFDSTSNESNIVRNNTLNQNFFVWLETEDASGNATSQVIINGVLTFDTNNSGALFRLTAGQGKGIVNGTINLLGSTIVTVGGDNTGTLFTLTKNASLDVKGTINILKNSNDVGLSSVTLIITNGKDSVEGIEPININISGNINVDAATFSSNIIWLQNGTKISVSGNIVITDTKTTDGRLFFFSGNSTSGRNVEGLISGNIDATNLTITDSFMTLTNGSKCKVTGNITATNFNTSNSNFVYIQSGSEWTLSGKLSIIDSTLKYHIFSLTNESKIKIEKNAIVELSNDNLWQYDNNDNLPHSFLYLGRTDEVVDIDGTVNIINGTKIRNIIYHSDDSSQNNTVNITGDINIVSDEAISEDDQKTTVEYFIRSIKAGLNMQVTGNINIKNTVITEKLILASGATEASPTVMTFSGNFNIDKCNFSKEYSSGVMGHVELQSNYITISVTGNFSMTDTTLSNNANFPFIDNSIGTLPSSQKSLVEFTGTTTLKGIESKSFFMFGGNDNNSFTSLRLGGKLTVKDCTLGGNGFINTATDFDYFATAIVEDSTMGRFLWAKNENLNNEITVPLTFKNTKFNFAVITSRGTLVIKNKIIIENCKVKQNVLAAAEQYTPTGSSEIKESKVGSLDIQDDVIITGTTVMGGSTNYYSGCIVVAGKNFSIADGKTLTIKGNTLHREANKTQSIIKIVNDVATFTLNKTGNLIIEDNTMIVDNMSEPVDGCISTAGTDGTTISAIYAKPSLKMELGGGKLIVKDNIATGSEADKKIADHMFGLYAENPLGFISQISGTKFNTNTNKVENVAFNTVDRTGIIYLDWKNGATAAQDYNKVFSADNYGVTGGVELSLYYDTIDGNLWINDGTSIHSHKLCGADNTEACNHRGISDHTSMGYLKLAAGATFPTSGSFYLSEDITGTGTTNPITLVSDLYLCLNGYNVSNIQINCGSFELHITNCSEQEPTITGPSGNNLLFVGGYPSILSSKGTINIKANRVLEDEGTLDKTLELYNVACSGLVSTAVSGDVIYFKSSANLSSVSVTDYTKNGNVAFTAHNEDKIDTMEVKLYDVKFKNITNSAALSGQFRLYSTKSIELYNCEFENCHATTTDTTQDYNGTLINIFKSNVLFDGCKFTNCSSTNRCFIDLNSSLANLTIKDSTIDGCSAKHNFLNWQTATGATLTLEGENNFINNTMNRSMVFCDGTFTNKGILNYVGNNVAQNGFYPADNDVVFNFAEPNSELNIKNNTFTEASDGGGILFVRTSKTVFNVGNVNIEGNNLGGRSAIRLSDHSQCNVTGKIKINNNRSTYRLIFVMNNELTFAGNSSLEIKNNTFIRGNKSEYLYCIDLNDNGTLKLDGNAVIDISDNICDAAGTGANTKGIVAAIQVKDVNLTGMSLGSAKVIIKNNKTINETLEDKKTNTYFYGMYANAANANNGLFVQIDGTTFNTQNYIEGIGFGSSDGTGVIYDSKGKDYTANLKAATVSNAELRTIFFNNMMYIAESNEPHNHKVCGTPAGVTCNHADIDAHTNSIMYAKFSGTALPDRGAIYLTQDLTLPNGGANITLSGDLYICLNGFNLNAGNTGNRFVNTANNYTLYITNCDAEKSPTFTQANGKYIMYNSSLQIYSISNENRINVSADHIMELNAGIVANADTVFHNVNFKQNTPGLVSAAPTMKYQSATRLIVKNVEFANYKLNGVHKIFDIDDGTDEKDIYFSDVVFKNLQEVDYDAFAIRSNNPEKPIVFNNVIFDNIDLGLHALIATRLQTAVRFTGDNYIKNIVGYSPIGNKTGYTYFMWLNDETAKFIVDGSLTIDNVTQTNQSTNQTNNMFYGTAGNFIINGTLNIKNTNQSATDGASWIFRDTGGDGGCNFTFNKGSVLNVSTASIIGKEGSKSSLFYMTKGKLTLNGDVNIENVTTNYKLIAVGEGDVESNIEMSSGNITIKNSSSSIEAIYIGKGMDIGANFEISNVTAKEILKIAGDCNVNGGITLKDNTAEYHVLNIGGNLNLSNKSNLHVEGNSIVRQENASQGIVNIDVKDIEIKALGKVIIKNNKLIANRKGTANTYAGALFVPDGSYLSIANNQIDISGNETEGSNKDANEFTHLYGVLSNNTEGFIKLSGNFNQSAKIENIGYSSIDGYGIVVNNYSSQTIPAGITADTVKDNELTVKVNNKALWVMSSLPPHQHKTCGLQSGETCNDASHKGLSNNHKLVLYSKMASTSIIPTKGSVYLSEDVRIENKLTLTNDMYICLNGHILTLNEVDLAGYHIWTTNCKQEEATITTFVFPSIPSGGIHTLENGNMSVVAAKGAINIETDSWMRTNGSGNDPYPYKYDVEYYNVHMSQVSQGQTNHTATYFDLNAQASEDTKSVLSKFTIEGVNNKGHLFYFNQSVIKLYDIEIKDVQVTERGILLYNISRDDHIIENLTMTNVKTADSTNNTQMILANANDLTITFNGYIKIDDVRGRQLFVVSASPTRKFVINADVDIRNSYFIQNVFAIGSGALELNGPVNIENVNSQNSLVYLSAGTFKAENNITISTYSVTGNNEPLLQAKNGSKTNINGNVEIRNTSVNYCMIELDNDDSEFIINGNLLIENAKNVNGTATNPFIKCQGTVDITGNLTMDNCDNVNHNGYIIDVVNNNNSFTVGKDFVFKNVAKSQGDVLMNVAGKMELKQNFIYDNITNSATDAGKMLVVGSDGSFIVNGNCNVSNSNYKFLDVEGSAEIKGNTTYTNMLGNSAISTTNAGSVTLQNIKVDSSNFTSVLKTNGENGQISAKNVEVTNSTVRDGAIYGKNISVNGNLVWTGNTSEQVIRNNFDITGTVEIRGNIITNMAVTTDDDFTISKNWTIKNNNFENGIVELAGSLNIADGITLDISGNTIKRADAAQNIINVKTAGAYINLNTTGVLKVQNNEVQAEVSPSANKNFAVINLANNDNTIKLGNGTFNLSGNILLATASIPEVDTNIVFEVLSQNYNGVISQNEGTKYNLTNNYVGLVAFNNGTEFIDGVIFASWNSNNVANLKPTSHTKAFEYLELEQAGLFFGLSIDNNDSLWLRKVSHENHLICGVSNAVGHQHHEITHAAGDEGEITYAPLKDLELLKDGGNYYLVSDLIYDTTTTISPANKLALCLNGFNIKNAIFRGDAESGKDVIIANCANSLVNNVIEHSGTDALFSDVSLFAKDKNITVRANKVVDGSEASIFDVEVTQYNNAKTGSVFLSINLILEKVSVSVFENKRYIIQGTNAGLYQTNIRSTSGAQYITDLTGTLTLGYGTSITENILTEGIINTNDLVIHTDVQDDINIMINAITRQNKTQTLIKTQGTVTYDGTGVVTISENEVVANIDTAKTNILSVFNFNADGAIVYDYLGASLQVSNNVISDGSTKAETGGNHIYSIYTTSEGPIFVKGSSGTDAKFKTEESYIIGIAFGTSDNQGTIFENWSDDNVSGDLDEYKNIFVIDTYLNPDIIVRKPDANVIAYKSQPFVLDFVAGELMASDGNTYKAKGTVNSISKAIDYDDSTDKELWIAVLPQIDYTLEGTKKLGWQLYGDSSVFYDMDKIAQEDDIDFEYLKSRSVDNHIKFVASWSEISYSLLFDLKGGAIDGGGSFPTTLKYYEKSEPLPKASKSESEFMGYKFLQFNPSLAADIEPNKTGLKAGDVIYKLFDLEDNMEIQYEANFIDANSMFTVVYYDNNGTQIATKEYKHFDNPKVGDGVSITKSGYTLQGFATTQAGAVVYKKGQAFNLSAISDNDLVELYAVWNKNSGGGGSYIGPSSSGGSGSGSSSPYIGPMGDLTKNPLYANLKNMPNNIPQERLTSNEVLANALLNNAANINAELTLVRDGANNTAAGKWLRVENTNNWFFFIGDTAQNGGFISNGWFNIGWAGQDRWYHFDSLGSMQTGWFMDKDGKLYYLLADMTNNFYGSIVTGIQVIDNKIYIFEESGALIVQYAQ